MVTRHECAYLTFFFGQVEDEGPRALDDGSIGTKDSSLSARKKPMESLHMQEDPIKDDECFICRDGGGKIELHYFFMVQYVHLPLGCTHLSPPVARIDLLRYLPTVMAQRMPLATPCGCA